MVLEKYDLRVAMNGPLSLTETEIVFRNPENRIMEGRFNYTLPPGATISRFAKDVNGKLMEGEVVEKLRAQSIYTEILHTMRDPALLEMDQGNRFSARVFPIPAGGTVRLLLGFSQLVPQQFGERRLTLPLAGLPKISDFGFTLLAAPWEGETLAASAPNGRLKDYTPEKDIIISARSSQSSSTRALKAGNFQMLTFKPELPMKKIDPSAYHWTFYFDTSASNADTEKQRLGAISALFDNTLGSSARGDSTLSLYAFDIDVAPLFTGAASAFRVAPNAGNKPARTLHPLLAARHALGATNLEAALKHLGEQARAAKEPTRFVLVSDGIATMGAREVRDVVAALGEWPAQHQLHAVVIGNKQDDKMLNAIVEKGKGRVVTLPFGEDLQRIASTASTELVRPIGASLEFYDEGAAWIYPKTFRDVQPGSDVTVFCELKGGPSKPGVIVREGGDSKGQDNVLAVVPAENPDFAPLLQREAYAAYLNHIDKLEQEEKDDKRRAEFRNQRLEISLKNRVLCALTSMLVLETEQDYRRFGIERTALADIMQIGPKGIELRKRSADEVPVAPPPKPAAVSKGQKAVEQIDGKDAVPQKQAQLKSELHDMDDRIAPASAADGGEAGQGSFGSRSGGGRRLMVQRHGGRVARDEADAPAQAGEDRTRGLSQDAAPALAPATAAPASPAPASTPAATQPARDEARRRIAENASAAAPQEVKRPDWTNQYQKKPTADELNTLRAKVQAAPRDRNLRNAYADALFKAEQWDSLQGQVFEWLPFDPENPQVFEYLGKSATGLNDSNLALRAYTSIAEVAPNRAALLARAGWLLLAAKKHELAIEMFKEALKNRQDDPNLYRGLALGYWLSGNFNAAAKTLEETLKKDFNNRYGDVKRVLKEELGYVLRAWSKKNLLDSEIGTIALGTAQRHGFDLKSADALRVTLAWETDANDVDLHVVDPYGEECFYSHKKNASGLELYSDQTQGLGPEVIRTGKVLPGVYHVGVNYFSAGAMGVSRGVVVIMQPNDGIVTEPQIIPFCLVPGGENMRHLGAAKF